MPERIGAVRVVPGDRWIADGHTGGPTRGFERYMLRRSFYDNLPGRWRLVTEPEECTEFDEEAREVKLWIGALAERITMADVQPTHPR
jgi:hypothetical protein